MSHISEQSSSVKFDDIYPGTDWWVGIKVFLSWSIPAFLFVLAVSFLNNYRSVVYYQEAISQGIGPVLWNVMGVFGLACFSLSIMFSRSKKIAIAAHKLLDNTFAIGSFSFGLLTAQVITQFPMDGVFLETWKNYLFGFAIFWLLMTLFIINFTLWYLGYLMQWKRSLRDKLSYISLWVRVPFGLLLFCLPLLLLWMRK